MLYCVSHVRVMCMLGRQGPCAGVTAQHRLKDSLCNALCQLAQAAQPAHVCVQQITTINLKLIYCMIARANFQPLPYCGGSSCIITSDVIHAYDTNVGAVESNSPKHMHSQHSRDLATVNGHPDLVLFSGNGRSGGENEAARQPWSSSSSNYQFKPPWSVAPT
jgi:hypothetical protein